MKREIFSHFNKTWNKTQVNYVDSPIGFINFNKNEFKILDVNLDDKIENTNKNNENNIKINNKVEIWEAFEYFLTDGKRELIDNLYYYRGDSFNFEELFKNDLMLQSTNKNLIDTLNKIPRNEIKDKEYINEQKNNFDCNINTKYKTNENMDIQIENKNEKGDNYIAIIRKRLK